MEIKNILCVSDMSQISKNAERVAFSFAKSFDAKLTILSCGDYYNHVPNNYLDDNTIQPMNESLNNWNYLKYLDQKRSETLDYFQALQKNMNLEFGEKISFEVKLENEVTATLDLLEEKKGSFDLIIAGKQNNSHWERLLFGSPGKEIFDETRIPTLLIPSEEQWFDWKPTRILSCTSLTGPDENAEIIAAKIAKNFGGEVTIMHVVDENIQSVSGSVSAIFPIDYIPPQVTEISVDEIVIQTKKKLDEISNDIQKIVPGQEIKTCVEVGQVSETVLNYLTNIGKSNLLIIGSRGENALKRFFLGSHTDVLEESCTIPILIVFYPG